jgi:putative protease
MFASNHKIPELLLPAGNLAKLKVACLYGADAVYLSGQHFGLRAAADNFTNIEMREGVAFAHQHGVKVYATLNGFLHDQDFSSLPEYLAFLQEIKIDALIISDLGVVALAKNKCRIPIHLSTQASCLNSYSADWWREQGVTRIVLGREVSIEEAAKIKQKTGLEVELFIHGSMCMAYSGNCTISNYTSGRDSNRGGCAHSCRFEYSLYDTQQPQIKKHSYFMSSKDLMGLDLLPTFAAYGIDSLKVEGRMKGPLYAANTARLYKRAIALTSEGVETTDLRWQWCLDELHKMSHREYTNASLITPAAGDSIHSQREGDENEALAAGEVVQVFPNQAIVVMVRAKFCGDDQLEILLFNGENITLQQPWIKDVSGRTLQSTRPGSIVLMPWVDGVSPQMLLRKLQVNALKQVTTESEVVT